MDTSTIFEPTDLEAVDRDVVDGFAALADPTRLAILQILCEGPHCVCDLNDQVPVAPNVLSYHLRVLREAGLVSTTRRGRWIDYAIARNAVARLRAAMPHPTADATPPAEESTA